MKPSTIIDHPTICPFCKGHNEALSDAFEETAPPSNGDVILCFRCGEWATYDNSWSGLLRKPTFAEYQELVANDYTVAARQAWLILKRNEGE